MIVRVCKVAGTIKDKNIFDDKNKVRAGFGWYHDG